MEIILTIGAIALLALFANRSKKTKTPPDDGEKAKDPVIDNKVVDDGSKNNAKDAEIIENNALELDAIDKIEAMIGEKDSIVFDTVPIRADGNGLGSATNPTDVPTRGQYYQVRDGDNPSHVMAAAGYAPTTWRVLARFNEWCQKRDANGVLVNMQFYKRWAAPGFATVLHSVHLEGDVFPVIYIPRLEEVQNG
jgi:hypothetical protein